MLRPKYEVKKKCSLQLGEYKHGLLQTLLTIFQICISVFCVLCVKTSEAFQAIIFQLMGEKLWGNEKEQ